MDRYYIRLRNVELGTSMWHHRRDGTPWYSYDERSAIACAYVLTHNLDGVLAVPVLMDDEAEEISA